MCATWHEGRPARVHREGDQPGEREARDRHEPLGHPRRVEPRHVSPEGLVAGKIGTEGEQAGQERRQPEQDGEATAAPDRDQARDRHERRQPADEHELLDAAPDVPRDEVPDLRRVPVDLGERAAGADRARHGPAVDDQTRAERSCGTDARLPPVGPRRARPRVAERERDRPQREVELARERDRRQTDGGGDESAPLEREQRRRQEKGAEPEQVARRLADPVGHQAEDEAADERGGTRDAKRPQPPARHRAREDEREQDDQVVRPHVPDRRGERPVGEPEQPALEARRRLRLGAERIRVGDRRPAALELVADQPERPVELEVVARGRFAVPGRRSRQVVRVVHVPDGGPRRPHGARRVEGEGDEHEAAATGHEPRRYRRGGTARPGRCIPPLSNEDLTGSSSRVRSSTRRSRTSG